MDLKKVKILAPLGNKLKIIAPQDEKDAATEKEKRMIAQAKDIIENEFYDNANLSRLFADQDPQSDLIKFVPLVVGVLQIITLFVLIAKK